MGQQKTYRVANLDYCGIYSSPFEFYSSEDWMELQAIGRIMEKKMKQFSATILQEPQYSREKFNWNIKELDKNFKGSQRYSPLYHKNIGIFEKTCPEKSAFHDFKEFKEIWREKFDRWMLDQKLSKKDKKTYKQQSTNCCYFDFLCFQSTLQYLYELKFIDILANNPQTDKYVQFMSKMFDSINLQEKRKKTMQALFENKGYDIIFLQRVEKEFLKEIRQRYMNQFYIINTNFNKYGELQDLDSMILISRKLGKVSAFSSNDHTVKCDSLKKLLGKKILFPKELTLFKSQLKQKYKNHQDETEIHNFLSKELNETYFTNWHGESVVALLNEDIILVSVNLASKPWKNAIQIDIFMEVLRRLNKNNEYNFIFGGNFNRFIGEDKLNDQGIDVVNEDEDKSENNRGEVFIFPEYDFTHTTKKKRTILQTQTKKANIMIKDCSDHIISNLRFEEKYVGEINPENHSELLPYGKHPYDSLLLEVEVKAPREQSYYN